MCWTTDQGKCCCQEHLFGSIYCDSSNFLYQYLPLSSIQNGQVPSLSVWQTPPFQAQYGCYFSVGSLTVSNTSKASSQVVRKLPTSQLSLVSTRPSSLTCVSDNHLTHLPGDPLPRLQLFSKHNHDNPLLSHCLEAETELAMARSPCLQLHLPLCPSLPGFCQPFLPRGPLCVCLRCSFSILHHVMFYMSFKGCPQRSLL